MEVDNNAGTAVIAIKAIVVTTELFEFLIKMEIPKAIIEKAGASSSPSTNTRPIAVNTTPVSSSF